MCPDQAQLGLAAEPKTIERPELRLLINPQTGEVVEDERDVLIGQLEAEKRGQSLQIGLLKKELRELRMVEPEAGVIKDVLDYWKERCRPTARIAIGGKRWDKVRARLRDRLDGREPWTLDELKLAVDGALLDPWLNGSDPQSKGKNWVLEAETIFKSPEQVERLRDLALGFEAKAGIGAPELIAVAHELHDVDWKVLLRTCMCGHRLCSHSKPDPNQEGCSPCLVCDCIDFDLDFCDSFNQRADPWLREWYGKGAA